MQIDAAAPICLLIVQMRIITNQLPQFPAKRAIKTVGRFPLFRPRCYCWHVGVARMQVAMGHAKMQRSQGSALVRFAHRMGQTRLVDLHQSGSGKAIMPRTHGGTPEVVFLNTSGGITDGDSLNFCMELGANGKLIATTQTAERAYASRGAAGKAVVTAAVGAGAHLDWVPQETILYDHCHLVRQTTIDLAGDASCLLCESVVLGRHAMGEDPAHARLTDHRMIRRDGRPVWADTVRIDADVLARRDSPALMGRARCFAVVVLVASGAAALLPALRRVLDQPGTLSAASAWGEKCVLRILACDSWPLKLQIVRALGVLRQGALPRVWQMQEPR